MSYVLCSFLLLYLLSVSINYLSAYDHIIVIIFSFFFVAVQSLPGQAGFNGEPGKPGTAVRLMLLLTNSAKHETDKNLIVRQA